LPIPNWKGLNEFVAVAETKSFNAAANRLGISVAQVSRQVKKQGETGETGDTHQIVK